MACSVLEDSTTWLCSILEQRCDLCSQPVLTRQFYLFPCAHVFHIDCITAEVKQYLDKNPRVRSWFNKLARLLAHVFLLLRACAQLKADVVAASGDGKGDASDSVDRDSVAAKGSFIPLVRPGWPDICLLA